MWCQCHTRTTQVQNNHLDATNVFSEKMSQLAINECATVQATSNFQAALSNDLMMFSMRLAQSWNEVQFTLRVHNSHLKTGQTRTEEYSHDAAIANLYNVCLVFGRRVIVIAGAQEI